MAPPSPSAKKRLTAAAKAYHEQVDESAQAYFESRGLTPAYCRSAGLGCVKDPLTGHEMFQGMLSLPYITPTGVVGLKFRCMASHKCSELGHQKYMGLPGANVMLYNTRAFLVDSPVIAVCEGEFDALAVHLTAGIPAIGYPGTQAWRPYWDRAFTGYQRVLVIADGDKPGRDAAKAVAKRITQADVVMLPDGEDANSLLIQAGGVEHFRELCGLEGDSE